MRARATGLLKMMDAENKDHRIIAIATGDPDSNAYQRAGELPLHRLFVLRRFLQDYKKLKHKAVEEIAPVATRASSARRSFRPQLWHVAKPLFRIGGDRQIHRISNRRKERPPPAMKGRPKP
jgi:Inorganic pyrophosphatase